MTRPRVLVVIGTRPEAIKMAPVAEALRSRADLVESAVALTGQHTDMVDQALEAFSIIPDFDLDIMKSGQTLYDVGRGCMEGLRDMIREFAPAMMLVQGDTASVFFGSLVGFFERIQVGHVEAGLRSRNRWAPYPEELFRQMTDTLAELHFAPTALARQNLLDEGISEASIHVTGNTVVDALLRLAHREAEIEDRVLAELLAGGGPLVLLTAHRRESFGEPLCRVFRAVREIADRCPDVQVIYPVHPNPQVVRPAREHLADHPRVHLTDPLAYPDLLRALKRASLVLTDSGGIQEEAPTFGTPVLVLREVTERPEGVAAGVARLVGTDRARIVAEALAALAGGNGEGDREGGFANPYGDGDAAERIADIVAQRLTGVPRRTRDWLPEAP
ncbi:MAG: UDP-N-acetylglucosamine 2-epimerase (non-hydrolyzing) [Gammaproteobacteria bacterium]|nr:UDP-N-acetylglucosamine 2-epimerase (non-hydrolyzing) [Gammaproteobacteria bacterium]MDE0257460.1 UDP-N-acetylglucosamine 2-epimerase (non-hydrolyzing) [Gammaproteobacteria bacterium]